MADAGEQDAAGQGALAVAPLFRAEVLAQRQAQWLGTVLVRPRPLHRWFAACALLIVALLVAALGLGSYTRKVRVSGWLVPVPGMVKVVAPRAGVVVRLLVGEGQEVGAGQSLLAVSSEERSAALGDTQAGAAQVLALQRASLRADAARAAQLYRQQRASIGARLDAMQAERKEMEQEVALQKVRTDLAAQSERRLARLQTSGFIAPQQVQAAAEARLDQEAKLRTLERNLITLGRERATLQGELADLPLKLAADTALTERSVASTERELADVEARRDLLIPAPQAGSVTAIHAVAGATLTPGMPLLSIVPRGALLEAQLYASSRAIGFVRARQQVLLRYRAYPYQKFGHYRGVIKNISRAGLEAGELPAEFAAGAAGAEALYRITVTLERQQATVYGKPVRLQPGMQLDADILLERRRLIEWVLDPIYTLTGQWTR